MWLIDCCLRIAAGESSTTVGRWRPKHFKDRPSSRIQNSYFINAPWTPPHCWSFARKSTFWGNALVDVDIKTFPTNIPFHRHHECSHLVVYSSSSRVQVGERRILMTLSCVEAPFACFWKGLLFVMHMISSSAFCCVSYMMLLAVC